MCTFVVGRQPAAYLLIQTIICLPLMTDTITLPKPMIKINCTFFLIVWLGKFLTGV